MNCSNSFESLLILISLVSLSCGICVQKSCPLGTFCPVNTNCSSDTSLCVTECNLKISQGNWSSGNCELVPEEYNYWLDATLYEVLIPPQLNAETAILNITFSVARFLQSDDEDDVFSGSGSGSGSGLGSAIVSGITFDLETDHTFFKFKNGDTSHTVLFDAASLTETYTIVTAMSNPIPLGDYEMQVSITRDNNMLQSSGVVIHVVETLPSILPAQTTCVEFEFSEYTALESAGLLEVTLLLLGREQLVSFNVTVIAYNDESSSSAIGNGLIAGLDFTPGQYNATFMPGATKATTIIPIMTDNLAEDIKQFNLRLYIDGVGYGLGLQSGRIRNAIAFIMQPNITGIVVEFKESVYSVVEDDGIYNVTVVKQGRSLQDIVVNIIPAPETAKLRFDYSQASTGRITFTPDGPNERTIQLSVDTDQLLELNETYLLRLNLPTASVNAGAQIGTINQARVTIINDDRIQVFLKRTFLETKEFEGVIIPVGFSPQKTTIPFTVRIETFDLTPPDAQAGIDYQPLIRNVTFSQLVASVAIQINIIENNITDGNRIFGLRLVIPEESKQLGIELGTPSESTITIIDDDVGDLELACYTTTNGDVISGHNITLRCKANQIVAYSCSVNNQLFQSCSNPYVIRTADARNPVTVAVNAIAPGVAPVSLTLTALTATAEVQIVGIGAIAVDIQSSKNATFRCRLNNGQLRTCVDGQIFDGLIAGTYTVTIDARGIENMQDVASYSVGPVVIVAGVNATSNKDIASCFGSWKENCSDNSQNCEYAATWRIKADQIEFTVMAKTQGWLSIGFSIDNKIPHSDVIVGATNGTISLLEDRYADQRSLLEKDEMQNIDMVSITIIDGNTIMSFVRDKITNDSDSDLNLNACRFILFAWGNDIKFNGGIIQYQRFNASSELICFPSSAVCPEKFDCGDPGTPVNGARNFSSTLEDSIVSYSCNSGYKLIGNNTRVCRVTPEEGALWKYDIPKCQFLTVAFARSEFNGSEESGSVDVEVILSQQLPSNASITIEVVASEQIPGSATGSGVDFVSDPINITFGPGENSKSLSIPVICDNIIEGTETFKASFSVQFNNVPIEIGLNNATVSIIDSTVEVMFNQSTYVINEDTQLVMFAIKLSQASKVPVGITINVTNTTAIGESFLQKIVNETIDAGTTEQSFSLQLARNSNSIIECTKTISLILSTQEICKTTTKNNGIAEINILNDDVGAVSLQIPDAVNESVGSFLINVSLNATASEDVVLNFTISDISTTDGSDYNQTEMSVSSMSSLTISSGELSGSLPIEVIDDIVKEQDETFLITVHIQDSCLPLVINGNNTFAITIIDNEELSVEFSQVLFSGLESSGGIAVMLNLLGGTASYTFNVTVTLSSSSASDGMDYDNAPLIATFNAGDTSATVMIPIANDNIKEENEELNLTVVISPLTGIKLGTLINARAIILDATLPKIITHPMDRTVEVNNDTTNTQLRCMASEAVSYEWEKQNGVIPADAEGVNSSTLTLIGITPTDGGRYRCIAINEHGRNYSDYATVIVTTYPPVVSVIPSLITANEGDGVTFTCLATGVGAGDFTYEWLLNGNLIQGINELNYNITVTERTIGNYSCIVKNQFGGSSQSNTAILDLRLPFCNSVTVTYSGFSITWNETQVGDTVEALCTGIGLTGTVRRSCIRRDIWEEFVECIREEINELMEEANDLISDLDKISDEEIISTVDDIVIELANLTLPEQTPMQLTSEFVVVVDVLSLLNNVTENVINTLQPNDTFFERTVQVLDNLLSTTNENNWQQLEQMSPNTSQKFITNIERFGRLLGETLNSEAMESTEARENIVIKAEIITEESIRLAQQPYMFPDKDDNMESFTGRSGQVLLPNMLLQEVLDKLPEDSTEFIITNFVLRDGSLPLPNPSNESTTKVPVSSIISSQLPVPVDDTMHPITLIFDVPSTTTLDQRSNGIISRQQHTCEFYNHTLRFDGDQMGAWSTVGIILDESRSNKTTVTCLSTHLTSFAVLEGIQNETQPPSVDGKRTLSVVACIGSALCLGFLIISIIILSLALYKNRGKAKLIFVHLNLCIALALGLVVFLAGIENARDNRVSCVVVAALLQYFFTSALCWMFSEGVMLYMMLVTVFSNKLNHQWFFFALGWGPAIPIVAISLGITHEQYGTDDHCWVESGKGALAAFILPILIVIIITCTFLMISLRVLYANQRKSSNEKKNSTRNTVKALLIITTIFLPLLGVTWIFGILAVNEEPAAFAWIFAILNVILGTLIFVFHVASDDQVGINKIMKACYKSETFFTFYSGIRYYTVSRNGNNGKSRSATGVDKTNNHVQKVEMSTSVSSIEDQSTTTTTFKPPELPLEDREVKRDPVILMAINPLEETALSEDGNTVAMRREMAVREETTSVQTNEH